MGSTSGLHQLDSHLVLHAPSSKTACQGQTLCTLCMYANLCTPEKLQHKSTPSLQITTAHAVPLLKQQLGLLLQAKQCDCCTLLSM